MEKFAQLAGYGSRASASVTFGNLRRKLKKLAEDTDGGASSTTSAVAAANGTPKKAAAPKIPKTPKSAKRGMEAAGLGGDDDYAAAAAGGGAGQGSPTKKIKAKKEIEKEKNDIRPFSMAGRKEGVRPLPTIDRENGVGGHVKLEVKDEEDAGRFLRGLSEFRDRE